MTWIERTERGFVAADRFLGRLVFRAVGMLTGLFTVFAFWFGVSALRGGEWMGVVILALGAAGGWVTHFCFRPERRLTEIED